MDGGGRIAVDDLFTALSVFDDPAGEKFGRNSVGTVGNRLGQLGLQALGKGVVALTGNNRKDIDVDS